MPQISQIAATYASQIFWLLITFGILYFGIGKMMVPRVTGVMDLRERQIAEDLATAERTRAEATTTEAAWQAEMDAARAAAQAEVVAAKSRAAQSTEAQMRDVDEQLNERIAHHDIAIGNAKAAAMVKVQDLAAETVQDLVAKVAGMTVSPEVAHAAVRQELHNV
ncbi:ATPase [Sphingomonas sp.]|uniref:F0F1 ATP synthase subunit B family protein n=1 Tax=Sphingomonas sp. TaxID=28214 RepID=UPI0035C874C4